MPQRVVAHAVIAQQFKSVQRLRAFADDVTDVVSNRQVVMVMPSILTEVKQRMSSMGGGRLRVGLHLLSVKIISTDFALFNLRLLLSAHRST